MTDVGIKMSEMGADTTVAGTEKLLVLDGTTSKMLTTAKMAEYAIDVLVAAAEATPTTGDDLLAVRSGAEKRLDLDALVTYVTTEIWADAAAVTPLLTGDLFLVNRSGTTGDCTVDVLKTYVLTGVQATVLNLSGLDAATLGATDLFAVCQTTTGKKVTLANLETKLWADYLAYVTGLTAVATAADANELYCIQSGEAKKLALSTLGVYMLAEIGADVIDNVWDDASTLTATQDGDVYVFERSGARKAVNAEYIADYVIAEFGAESAVVAAADADKLAMWRGSTAGTLTVDLLATYVQNTILDDWAAVSPLLDADKILVNRSAGKHVTAANLKTYVLTDIQATVLNISGLSSATPSAADELLFCESGTGKKCAFSDMETQLWADFKTYVLSTLPDAATVADADKFYVINGTTAKYCTATELATYMVAEFWSAAAAASVVTGDTLLIDHSGTMKEVTVDLLADFILTDAQDTMLDLTTLDEQASISATDTLLLCQTGTPVYVELSDLASDILGTLDTYLAALGAVTSVAGADLIYCTQSGTAKKITVETLADHIVDQANELPWKLIDSAKYTALPPSTSTITMSDTSDFAIGLPVKYTYGGSTYYGIVTAINANALLTIAGATLNAATELTALYVGTPGGVVEKEYRVDTAWAGAVQDVFSAITYERHAWRGRKAYLVAFAATQGVADTGANQPQLNVKINSQLVGTEDGGDGLQLSATPGTWVESSAVAISTTYYDINRGEAIELRCTSAGTNGDADVLSVSLTFVYE